jgi:hypothetical protein
MSTFLLPLNLQCISLLVLSFSKELSIQVGRPLTVLWRSLKSSRPALRTFFLYQTMAEAQQKSSAFLVCSFSCKKHDKGIAAKDVQILLFVCAAVSCC